MSTDRQSVLAFTPRLAAEFARPDGPTFLRLPGAVLAADISGFTPLAERLAQAPGGAERLSSVLNEYFGIAIDLIYEYGGDVIESWDQFVEKNRGNAGYVAFLQMYKQYN